MITIEALRPKVVPLEVPYNIKLPQDILQPVSLSLREKYEHFMRMIEIKETRMLSLDGRMLEAAREDLKYYKAVKVRRFERLHPEVKTQICRLS
jgi:hypothetical protein